MTTFLNLRRPPYRTYSITQLCREFGATPRALRERLRERRQKRHRERRGHLGVVDRKRAVGAHGGARRCGGQAIEEERRQLLAHDPAGLGLTQQVPPRGPIGEPEARLDE